MATDVRTVPDALLNAYLYPIAVWGVGYGGLYFFERDAYAIPLLYPLALWQIGLTLIFAARSARKYSNDEVTLPEIAAGIKSIGGIAAADSLLPAVVFLVNDPLSSSAHGTALGVAFVAGLAYGLVQLAHRVTNTYVQIASLTFACLALPINTTGAVTMAEMVGWFNQVAEPGKEILRETVPLP